MKFKSKEFDRYFKNTSWLMGEKILSIFVTFIVGAYVVRYLGPAQYGILSYAISFVALFMAFSTLGLESIIVREIVKTPHKKNAILGTALGLKVIGTVFMWIVVGAVLFWTKGDALTKNIIFIIMGAIIFQAFNVIDFNFQAEVQSKYVVNAQLVQLIISSIMKIVFVLYEFQLIWFAFIFVVDAVILSLGLIVMYIRNSGNICQWKWKKEVAKDLLKESWPLMFAYMSYLIYTRIDQVMIKNMLDDYSVGIYAAAYKLYEVPLLIALLTAKSLYPLVVKYYQESKQKLFDFYLKVTSYMTLLGYVLIILFFLCSKKAILFLYGNEFIESEKIVLLLSFGLIPLFNAFLRSTYITVSNNQKIILYTTVFSCLGNVLLNFYLIQLLGIVGAVYATLITQVLSLFLLNVFFQPTRKIFFIQAQALLLRGIRK